MGAQGTCNRRSSSVRMRAGHAIGNAGELPVSPVARATRREGWLYNSSASIAAVHGRASLLTAAAGQTRYVKRVASPAPADRRGWGLWPELVQARPGGSKAGCAPPARCDSLITKTNCYLRRLTAPRRPTAAEHSPSMCLTLWGWGGKDPTFPCCVTASNPSRTVIWTDHAQGSLRRASRAAPPQARLRNQLRLCQRGAAPSPPSPGASSASCPPHRP